MPPSHLDSCPVSKLVSVLALTSKLQTGCIKPSVLSSRRSQGLFNSTSDLRSVLQHRENTDMKPVPLLLLLSSVLLSSHLRPATGRPRVLPAWLDGGGRLQTHQMDAALLRAAAAGDGSASDLLGESILRFLQESRADPAHLLPPEEEREEQDEEEAEEEARTAAMLLKRSEEPPLSIDLTFHLLRNMIQMAKMESQRERAQLNRKVLDEVGK